VSKKSLPQIPLGRFTISRLVLGDNTIHGGSHLTRFVGEEMKRYYTSQRIQELLIDCENEGINAWQSNFFLMDRFREHRAMGGNLQLITLGKEEPDCEAAMARMVRLGGIGIAHHGELTDVLFREGKLDEIEDYLKKVRDSGMAVGVSTHIPDVIDYVESRGWDVDFYMACVYERHRSREQLQELLGYVPVPLKEVYLEEDPPRMFAAICNTKRPCLAFKILAAGRLCEKQETVEEAFRETFRQIKANDAVLVGMYPKFENQVALNADYVRQFSKLSKPVKNPKKKRAK